MKSRRTSGKSGTRSPGLKNNWVATIYALVGLNRYGRSWLGRQTSGAPGMGDVAYAPNWAKVVPPIGGRRAAIQDTFRRRCISEAASPPSSLVDVVQLEKRRVSRPSATSSPAQILPGQLVDGLASHQHHVTLNLAPKIAKGSLDACLPSARKGVQINPPARAGFCTDR